MLIGNRDAALPQDELTYAALRLAAVDTLIQIETDADSQADGESIGYLGMVPVLAQVAPAVQVDLLADVWSRHRSQEPHKATLLDAAVVYAACATAAQLVRDDAELARRHLAAGPSPRLPTVDASLPDRFPSLFESFWDDIDFLTLEHFGDLDPHQAKRIKKELGISNRQIKKLEAALARSHAAPDILARLDGLLTDDECQAWSRWLVPPLVVSLAEVVGEVDLTGDMCQAYINRKTGELFTLTDNELSSLDDEFDDDAPDWQVEANAKARSILNSDDWLELPSMRDFHEWELMARFCQSIDNEILREDFLDAIRGSGAFSRFKNMAHRHGLIDDWYRLRDSALSEFVASWLRANGFAYRK